MLIFMTIAAILVYAGLTRRSGKSNRSERSSSPETEQRSQIDDAGTSVGEVPEADAGAEAAGARSTWTALDDLQLNRLLRESS